VGLGQRLCGREAWQMILVRNLKLRPDENEARLKKLAAKKLRIGEDSILSLKIVKRSLDARKKDDIRRIYSLALEVTGDEEKLIVRAKSADVRSSLWYSRCFFPM